MKTFVHCVHYYTLILFKRLNRIQLPALFNQTQLYNTLNVSIVDLNLTHSDLSAMWSWFHGKQQDTSWINKNYQLINSVTNTIFRFFFFCILFSLFICKKLEIKWIWNICKLRNSWISLSFSCERKKKNRCTLCTM